MAEHRLTFKLYSHPMWDSFDALRPERLIELWVDPDIGRAHGLPCKLDDGLDRPGSALLERPAVHAFVQMDGVFACDDVLQRRAGFAA